MINQHYMYLDPQTSLLRTFIPAAAVVFRSLMKVSEIEEALKVIFYRKGPITADTIGRLLEFYLIDKLKPLTLCQVQYNTGQIKNQEFRFFINATKEIEALDTLPDKKPEMNTLYIPKNPNYPCVDLLYYDFNKKKLYPIQITVSLNAHKASHKEFEGEYLPKWRDFLDIKDLPMQFIWIGGGWNPEKLKLENSSCLTTTENSWYISYKQFPASQFALFRALHDDGFMESGPACKIDAIPGMSSAWKAQTFEDKFKRWFVDILKSQEGEVSIYFSVDSKGNY